MSKLTKKQKEFLKGIPNKKARQEQKIQFKLQNSYNGKGKTWYETLSEEEREKIEKSIPEGWIILGNPDEKHVWHEHNIGESFEKMKNSLTKEVLNDLTNPIQVKNRIEIYTLEELSQFKDLTLKEVNDCLYILYQMQTNDASNLLLKIFMNIKDKIINPEKQDIIEKSNNNDIPMEFCVEITKENVACLTFIWATFHKDTFGILKPGSFLHSNSLFTYCIQSNVPTNNKIVYIVSTEEFLRYIGKEYLIPKENNHKFIDYGEFKNTIPDFKHNFNQKPLEFDLPKKVDFSSNYIDSISKFHELILKQIQEGSDPISTINDYLINVQKFYYYKTNNKIAEITEIFPKLENKTFPNSNNENVIKIKFDASKLTNNETKSENLDFELEKSIVNLVNNITALKMQVGNFNHKGYSIVFVRDDSKIWDIQYPIRKKA